MSGLSMYQTDPLPSDQEVPRICSAIILTVQTGHVSLIPCVFATEYQPGDRAVLRVH
ncbi:hypothetical protein F751_0656 [Auxenochlorella protothecoides]|uniref:Uncharacterized protein n=1 Tax=Auxenochlorella protothecoides TaxID=3075 RepID=A0A087SQG6_AUXPR|nr:hypothetical protein F751_0656 [Auxenochlorella protothecoides]KFM27970.1 hypothetical protein F751_0656 [Auxenochlorella protothecoides]